MFQPSPCRRKSPDPPFSEIIFSDTLVSDAEEHHEYQTVQVEDRLWLAGNLRLPVERVGTFFGERSWDAYAKPEEETPVSQFYTWRAAMEAAERFGNGWRLPSDDDFQGLAIAFGGYYDFAERRNMHVLPSAKRRSRRAKIKEMRLHHGGWRGLTGDQRWGGWQGVYWTRDLHARWRSYAICYAFRLEAGEVKSGIRRFLGYRRNAYAVRLVRPA